MQSFTFIFLYFSTLCCVRVSQIEDVDEDDDGEEDNVPLPMEELRKRAQKALERRSEGGGAVKKAVPNRRGR